MKVWTLENNGKYFRCGLEFTDEVRYIKIYTNAGYPKRARTKALNYLKDYKGYWDGGEYVVPQWVTECLEFFENAKVVEYDLVPVVKGSVSET